MSQESPECVTYPCTLFLSCVGFHVLPFCCWLLIAFLLSWADPCWSVWGPEDVGLLLCYFGVLVHHTVHLFVEPLLQIQLMRTLLIFCNMAYVPVGGFPVRDLLPTD
jgi:hypothetical protein